MATWNGTSKKFQLERYAPEDYGYGHYEYVEFNWSYNTTSDYLTITEKDSQEEKVEVFSRYRAEAMLYTIAQWYGRFVGIEELKLLHKDILEAE